MWVVRHALAIVVVALALTAGVFVFALPQYRPDRNHQYDMTGRDHFTVLQVERAFAAHGLRLRNGDVVSNAAARGSWLRPLLGPDGLEVDVFGPRSKVGWNFSGHEPLSVVV